MLQIVQNKNGYFANNLWLILFIVSILIISSCSGVRSIRSGNNLYHPKQDITKDNNESGSIESPEPKEMISNEKIDDSEFIEPQAIQNEAKDYSKLAGIVGDRLPTIREQMQDLGKSQELIKNDIAQMQDDIREIRNLIYDLKGTVDDYIPAGTRLPVTGNIKVNEDKKQSSFELLPDEKVADKKIETKPKNTMITKKAISETFLKSDESSVKKSSPKAQIKNEVATKTDDVNIGINPLFNEGKELYSTKKYSEAIESLKKALSQETSKKQESEINFYLGESYYFINKYDLSIDYLNKVLSFNDSPFLDAARIRKAEANLKSGNISEAKADYQALIKNHPGSNHIPKARKMLQQL
ncbi:MAG: tetratricopeptide repeat protein [Candidatus Kapabacteria bacterium]|nr:tetratricopeptide repeat protein [Ignavibacteriota bacterium]MCW5884352.1 tetratricopeptide repeat protein [Candidatus Kapabacteria bacterium]